MKLGKNQKKEEKILMSGNIGKVDQAMRIIMGSIFLGTIAYAVSPIIQTLLGSLGIYLIVSSGSGSCLIYSLLNINTRRSEKDNLFNSF